MKTRTLTGMRVALMALAIGTSSVQAARKEPSPQTPLTEAGENLLQGYAGMLAELKEDISGALPVLDE
jgi:hypothetical protein